MNDVLLRHSIFQFNYCLIWHFYRNVFRIQRVTHFGSSLKHWTHSLLSTTLKTLFLQIFVYELIKRGDTSMHWRLQWVIFWRLFYKIPVNTSIHSLFIWFVFIFIFSFGLQIESSIMEMSFDVDLNIEEDGNQTINDSIY